MEALQRLHNRGSISTGYDIDNSIKLEDDNDEFLTRTNASGTNRKTWTVSVWFKQTELASMRNSYTEIWDGGVFGEGTRMGMDNTDRFWIDIGGGTGNTGTNYRNFSTLKLRDTSAWYHLVVALDTTQSTAANRLKVWLNGTEITAWDQQQIPAQNYQCAVEAGVTMTWGAYNATYHGFSGYLAECNYVDGVTATQNDFGEYDEDTGIWKPKEYTGSYGTNGCYLDFSDASDLGANAKGNDANFTLNNITSADQATDTPTNNFATFNPLLPNSSEKEGATVFINPDAGADTNLSTISVANGKWYAEFKASSNISGDNGMVGVAANSGDSIDGRFLGQDAWSVGLLTNGSYYINSSATSYLGTTFNQDIISVALDMDNKKVYFAKNGTWGNSGNPATGTNGIALPSAYEDYEWFIGTSLVLSTATYDGNYGGYTVISIASGNTDANGYGTFEYAPPSGYYALCTKNLEEFG
jgi:hypothetical protein